jgi:hypothetical protein
VDLIDARWEEQRVAPVVGIVGIGASWWSLRMGQDGGTGQVPKAAGDEKRFGDSKTRWRWRVLLGLLQSVQKKK